MAPEGTAATVLELLWGGRRQVQELAATLHIDTSAARRHLENLRAEGYVAAKGVVMGPGRPKKMCSLALAWRERFPRDCALLLNLLLAKLEQMRGRDEHGAVVPSMAGDVGGPPLLRRGRRMRA